MIGFNQEQAPLSPELLKRIEMKVFMMEKENHPIKIISDSAMVQKIQKAIDEIVRSEALK